MPSKCSSMATTKSATARPAHVNAIAYDPAKAAIAATTAIATTPPNATRPARLALRYSSVGTPVSVLTTGPDSRLWDIPHSLRDSHQRATEVNVGIDCWFRRE